MRRYDDRDSRDARDARDPRDGRATTKLYIGHLSSRTQSRDLDDIFSRYGRVRDVDMKRDYAFVEFSDPRDADDARHSLNGREVDGSRIIVEHAKGVPRGPGGSRDHHGRGPPPGSGRCFNCGIEGHWAQDCKAGDWKNKCYRCGERGHIERKCTRSPRKTKRGRSYSRSPSPRRGRSRSRSYSRSHSYSRSKSPVRRDRSVDLKDRRSRSPKRSRASPPPSKGRKRSSISADRSPREKGDDNRAAANGSDYNGSPKNGGTRRDTGFTDRSPSVENRISRSPSPLPPRDKNRSLSPVPPRDNKRSPSPVLHDNHSPVDDDENGSPRGSE